MDRQQGKIGIYKITNLNNNKLYIGQSRNIYRRWKQHTSNLPENKPTSRIRAAFQKYGLNQIVYKEGIYGNFKFEILKLYDEEDLLKEEEYIEKLKPEYNCSILTSDEYYQGNYKNRIKKYWIQYHNFEAENGYPSQNILTDNDGSLLIDSHHYISTRKRCILYSKGDIIYLILGKIINKKKHYYLWSKTIVEEIDFLEDEDLIYNAFGEQNFIDPPFLLNNIYGFIGFLKTTGNFGLGFQNISNRPFLEVLEETYKKYKCQNEEDITYNEYIDKFEKNCDNGV